MKPSDLPLYYIALAAAILAILLAFAVANPAQSHSWYDAACCSDKDCAEVTAVQDHPDGWLMTTKFGTTLVPINMPKGQEWREKENKHDGKTHVCMRKPIGWEGWGEPPPEPPGGMEFLCIYRPSLS